MSQSMLINLFLSLSFGLPLSFFPSPDLISEIFAPALICWETSEFHSIAGELTKTVLIPGDRRTILLAFEFRSGRSTSGLPHVPTWTTPYLPDSIMTCYFLLAAV